MYFNHPLRDGKFLRALLLALETGFAITRLLFLRKLAVAKTRGPVIVIYPEETCYIQVKPEDVPEIIEKTIKKPMTF